MIIKTFGDPAHSPVNEWLQNNALYLALGVAGAILIVVLILFLLSLKNKKKR